MNDFRTIHRLNFLIIFISIQFINAQTIVNEENIYLDEDARNCYLESKYIFSKNEFEDLMEIENKLNSINCNEYFERGKKVFCYKNGNIYSGISRVYKKDSIPLYEYQYENGILISTSYFYRKSNMVSLKQEYDSMGNVVKEYFYHLNGNLRQYNEYKDGKRNGLHRVYYPDGTILFECTFKNNKKEGIATIYEDNGNVCRQTEYKNGKKDGKDICYCPNEGTQPTVIVYKEGKKVK